MDIQGKRFLILGAGGQIGVETALRISALSPQSICIHSLKKEEVTSLKKQIQQISPNLDVFLSWGDIFMTNENIYYQGDVLDCKREFSYEEIDCLLSRQTRIYKLTLLFKPDIIIDATNSATTLSNYEIPMPRVNEKYRVLIYDSLKLEIGIYSLKKFILGLRFCFDELELSSYIKVSTTGLGGLGLNIEYTHGDENKSFLSENIWNKLIFSGVQHQMLWSLARTVAKEKKQVKIVVPATLVGFEQLSSFAIKNIERVSTKEDKVCIYRTNTCSKDQ
ncbi:MAG: hypothetical protein GY710_24960 [Desulfobacteraceae bacterium]|nr:hypothetical protein [Desulfobacteraceae bacterium]